MMSGGATSAGFCNLTGGLMEEMLLAPPLPQWILPQVRPLAPHVAPVAEHLTNSCFTLVSLPHHEYVQVRMC